MSAPATAKSEAPATVAVPLPRFRIDADGARVRTLAKPIRGHEGQINELRLAAPKYRDFMDLGDPTAYIVMNGAYLPHEDHAIIDKYVERLTGVNGQFVDQVGLDDAMALKEMVLSFFRQESASSSTTAPTT